eukprot:6463436-Amphidinium_carterae.1
MVKRGRAGDVVAPPKAKAKVAANRAPAAPTSIIEATVAKANAEHFACIADCLAVIGGHAKFKDFRTAAPLTLAQGASQAPFHLPSFQKSMENTKSYKCGGNMFWVSEHMDPLTSHVAVKSTKVKQLSAMLYKAPAPPLSDLVVSVPLGIENPLDMAPALRRLSPCENMHAIILAV